MIQTYNIDPVNTLKPDYRRKWYSNDMIRGSSVFAKVLTNSRYSRLDRLGFQHDANTLTAHYCPPTLQNECSIIS
jgi:hypothetical protein